MALRVRLGPPPRISAPMRHLALSLLAFASVHAADIHLYPGSIAPLRDV